MHRICFISVVLRCAGARWHHHGALSGSGGAAAALSAVAAGAKPCHGPALRRPQGAARAALTRRVAAAAGGRTGRGALLPALRGSAAGIPHRRRRPWRGARQSRHSPRADSVGRRAGAWAAAAGASGSHDSPWCAARRSSAPQPRRPCRAPGGRRRTADGRGEGQGLGHARRHGRGERRAAGAPEPAAAAGELAEWQARALTVYPSWHALLPTWGPDTMLSVGEYGLRGARATLVFYTAKSGRARVCVTRVVMGVE